MFEDQDEEWIVEFQMPESEEVQFQDAPELDAETKISVERDVVHNMNKGDAETNVEEIQSQVLEDGSHTYPSNGE